MDECILVLLAAFLLDLTLGDPEYALHPVRVVGKAIAFLDATLRRIGLSGTVVGTLLVPATLSLSIGGYFGLRYALHCAHHWLAVILDVFLIYSCFAFRDLLYHAKLVADALERNDLAEARVAVRRIVGRDVSKLDASGVARAAIESVAENFVDGFLSPFFWYVVGSVVARFGGFQPCVGAVLGTLTFRTVNTLDSMVGYYNERYMYFGRASAKLDDVMNFLPARLSIPIISLSASICGVNATNCMRIGRRDRLKHPSPNAGHAESCVAGALGIRLGGPVIYSHGIVEKQWLGDGTPDVSHVHIYKCRILILWSGLVTLCISLLGFGALI